ncbi:MAG: hypothetical protein IJX85_10960 [Lachnospiraceae bacterium]|nr:hypothetical protein [Lachnospiraceae bacterium]
MRIIGKWKKTSLICVLATMAMIITGCDKISEEEKSQLDDNKENAAIYYNGKYDLNETVEDYDYDYNEGLFGNAYDTTTMYFEMSDGYVVVYDVAEDRMLDNRQSEEIEKAINEELWPDIFSQVKNITGQEMYCEKIESIKYSSYGAGGDRRDNFFTEYYEGDIKSYLAKEDVELYANMSDMIIVCDDDSWNEAVAYIETEMESCFARYDVYWDIEILTSDLYEKYKGNYKDYRGSLYGYEGYVARVRMENESGASELVIDRPTYIQVCPGVYMTSDEFDFALCEGDVILEEAMTGDELADYCESVQVTVDGSVYKVVFSERVKDYLKTEGKGYLKVCCKIVPEELSVQTTMEFCELSNGVTDDVVMKDFHSEDWDDNLEIAHYVTVCDDDLYFFGEYEATE